MTDTQARVEIPADVKDNSPHTVRFTWRGTVPEELTEKDLYLAREVFKYTVYQWDDVNRAGERATITRMDDTLNRNVWLYETTYYTRVKCTDCEHCWAQYYLQVTDADGVTHPAAPFCGTHANVELSRMGNPRFRVTFTNGLVAQTQTDSSVGYSIENPEYRDVPVVVSFTKAGRIYGVDVAN